MPTEAQYPDFHYVWPSTVHSNHKSAAELSCSYLYFPSSTGCHRHYIRGLLEKYPTFFLCEHLMDYNLARLHEPTLNLSAHT